MKSLLLIALLISGVVVSIQVSADIEKKADKICFEASTILNQQFDKLPPSVTKHYVTGNHKDCSLTLQQLIKAGKNKETIAINACKYAKGNRAWVKQPSFNGFDPAPCQKALLTLEQLFD
jgi:hypothetical protein